VGDCACYDDGHQSQKADTAETAGRTCEVCRSVWTLIVDQDLRHDLDLRVAATGPLVRDPPAVAIFHWSRRFARTLRLGSATRV
jgi:hypothetical protein